ncbi:hypothetical protein RvY_12777 [Ramazzottius varieornatus]|uniref:Uncharacterized protein n=1 Tax=Ramazzottius varieornatus TaxID=947166 RepID=A0A1D1VKN9_RAMVA|nr:hypothetical protein RvY_12777 [Ramazzottius varieornatus]
MYSLQFLIDFSFFEFRVSGLWTLDKHTVSSAPRCRSSSVSLRHLDQVRRTEDPGDFAYVWRWKNRLHGERRKELYSLFDRRPFLRQPSWRYPIQSWSYMRTSSIDTLTRQVLSNPRALYGRWV